MKILLLIDSFNVGGAQRQFVALASELKKYYEIEIIAFHPHSSYLEQELINLEIPIKKILKKSRYDILFIFNLINFVRKSNYKVSISFLDTPNFYNELLKCFGAVPKIIISQRSAYFKESLTLKKRFFETFHSFADIITTNSISQAERMKQCFPFLSNKINYTPNLYNIKSVFHKSTSNANLKFIVVSNTHFYKNPLKLCEAICIYYEKYGSINFEINWYGHISTVDRDYSLLQKGLNLLKENNLQNTLQFKGVTNDVYKRIYEADVLIHLSDFEGCPNSVCESMFLKKPVLLSNVCDHPYLVSNKNGFLVNQKDSKAIADKINSIIKMNPTELIEMGNLSSELIERIMNRDKVLNKWLKLIKHLDN
jgi:glycosyltransferase involved in cell wall biosynthesis